MVKRTKEETLARAIVRLSEQAFRRGYQHGAIYGHGHKDKIETWRFDGDMLTSHIPPGGIVPTEEPAIERVFSELSALAADDEAQVITEALEPWREKLGRKPPKKRA